MNIFIRPTLVAWEMTSQIKILIAQHGNMLAKYECDVAIEREKSVDKNPV